MHDRVAEDVKSYRQIVRPNMTGKFKALVNTVAEHPMMHDWFVKRGLKVVKSNYSWYDDRTHTLHHWNPEDKSAVVRSYLTHQLKPVKLAREDEEASFRAAMRENPDDHVTRGVYADWLEENGHDEPARRLRAWARVIPHILAHPLGLMWVHNRSMKNNKLEPWQRELVHQLHFRHYYGTHPIGSNEHEFAHETLPAAELKSIGLPVEAPSHSRLSTSHEWVEANPTNSGYGGLGGENVAAEHFKLARNEFKQPGAGSAARTIGSANHKVRVQLAQTILSEAGLQGRVKAVLSHEGATGIRPAVSAFIRSAHPKVARFAAAWMAMLTGEPRVTVFHPGEGEDVLHIVDTPHPTQHVGEYLKRAGVPSFSMESRGTGTRAFIVNPMDLIDVETAARGLQGTVSKVPGTAVRLGAGTQKDARAAYRQVIADSEKEAGSE